VGGGAVGTSLAGDQPKGATDRRLPQEDDVRNDEQRNEGEGNKTAARAYNRKATEHARSGQAERKAREAADALDRPEGRKLEEAAEKGKAPLRGERHADRR
jgi:hypothetical protein